MSGFFFGDGKIIHIKILRHKHFLIFFLAPVGSFSIDFVSHISFLNRGYIQQLDEQLQKTLRRAFLKPSLHEIML